MSPCICRRSRHLRWSETFCQIVWRRHQKKIGHLSISMCWARFSNQIAQVMSVFAKNTPPNRQLGPFGGLKPQISQVEWPTVVPIIVAGAWSRHVGIRSVQKDRPEIMSSFCINQLFIRKGQELPFHPSLARKIVLFKRFKIGGAETFEFWLASTFPKLAH